MVPVGWDVWLLAVTNALEAADVCAGRLWKLDLCNAWLQMLVLVVAAVGGSGSGRRQRQAADVIDMSESRQPDDKTPPCPRAYKYHSTPPARLRASASSPASTTADLSFQPRLLVPRLTRCFVPAVSWLSWSSSCCWTTAAALCCPAEMKG